MDKLDELAVMLKSGRLLWYLPVAMPKGMKRIYAWADWLQGMKPRQIARKYGVAVNTVRSWYSRYRWADDRLRLYLSVQLRLCFPYEDERLIKMVIERAIAAQKKARACPRIAPDVAGALPKSKTPIHNRKVS